MMADPLADIDRAIQQIKSKAEPKRTDMIELSSLLENFEKTSSSMKKGAHIKNKAQTAIVHFNLFPALHSCEELLPLYFFVGKYSETLGLHGVFDMLEKKEYFRNSLKFHVMWAETHAKKGHGQRFREILELAQKRLQEPQDMIESEFKSLAQQYLPNSNIFPDVTSKKKDRRRSHLDVLQKLADRFKTAKRVTSEKNVKIMLKHEFVDKIGYIPVSPEEYVWVQWLDDQGQQADEDDMDVSMQDATLQPSPKVVEPVHTPLMPKIPDYIVDEPKLEPVLEISEPEISMEKRRRIFSPEQPTRTSRFPNPPTHMAESPVSFREKEYQKAAAVFSDTVNLGPAPSKDITIPVISQPVETFEVYEDAESVAVPAVQPSCERRPLSQLNIVDRMDESPVLETKDTAKIPDPFGLDLSDVENDDGGSPYNFEDDPTLAGQRYGLTGDAKPTAGIVTSTPAPGLMGFGQNITPDDFFSVPIEENFGFIKKRQSLAPKTDFRASAQRSSVTPPQKETTISSAMAQMTVKSPVGVEEEENILERTGINKPRESISTQSINPWDSSVREKIMKRSKTPLVQHDFQYASPKISRNKDLTVGGMKFHVIDLVGEGGFAKVFKCVDEESQKTVALKYEVPSCSWEVYICDQLRSRLQQTVTPSARRSINCVMEITDAFIFKNSSILINEFLRYGTLLDLSNKLHGGAHSQLILLLSIQIATIIRDVQACQIIHGDVKPDNIMILRGIDENWDIEELLTTPLLKFIDWGRAIDMAAFEKTTSFKGRAGTANFDCPEMTDKPWNYQTDFFGFVATMHVFIFGKYCKLLTVGRNTMDCSLKRRLACRDVMTNIFDRLLNIPSCQELPDWNEIIAEMISIFRQEFSAVEWRATARTFNQSLPDDK